MKQEYALISRDGFVLKSLERFILLHGNIVSTAYVIYLYLSFCLGKYHLECQ